MTVVTRNKTISWQERAIDPKAVAALAAYRHNFGKVFQRKPLEELVDIREVFKEFPDGAVFGVLVNGLPFVKLEGVFYELLLGKIPSESSDY